MLLFKIINVFANFLILSDTLLFFITKDDECYYMVQQFYYKVRQVAQSATERFELPSEKLHKMFEGNPGEIDFCSS